MGLFDLKKEICVICNKECGFNKVKIVLDNEYVCGKCFTKCGFSTCSQIEKMTVSEIKDIYLKKEEMDNELKNFIPTKKVKTFLEINEDKKQWLVPDGLWGTRIDCKIYKFSDIIDFELLEDGSSILKGGLVKTLGRSIVGGVLFGGIGAVIGGVTGSKKSKPVCDSLKIKITVDDITNPAIYINFIKKPIKKSSMSYKSIFKDVQECLSLLQLMCNETLDLNNNLNLSEADEIMKFKELLDNGIITEEEFEKKKKQILDL